jgi:hypothetical protein
VANADTARIGLEDIIAAAGQVAVRALSARQQAATTNNGFYIEVHIRCGYPPVTLNAVGAVENALERGPRPPGPPGKD